MTNGSLLSEIRPVVFNVAWYIQQVSLNSVKFLVICYVASSD